MAIHVYDIETTLTRVVRVTFDDAILADHERPQDVAEEFGSRPGSWPEYAEVIEDDLQVESVREVSVTSANSSPQPRSNKEGGA